MSQERKIIQTVATVHGTRAQGERDDLLSRKAPHIDQLFFLDIFPRLTFTFTHFLCPYFFPLFTDTLLSVFCLSFKRNPLNSS